MGDIGANPREVEFEPIDIPISIPEPAPASPVEVPQEEPVPA